jgi:hypothetical protein
MVMLTVALLPPQFVVHLFFGPLQDEKEKRATAERSRNDVLKFMQTPASN